MHRTRQLAVLGVPFILLVACTSQAQTPVTSTSTAVTSVPATSSSAAVPAAPTVPAVTSKHTGAARTTPVKATPTATHPAAAAAPIVDPLTGGKYSTNPVLAVKIDNTYFGVPQFGISDADIVFVEQVEGGLTRLIGIFHSDLGVEVGPVRSVRSTDSQLLPVFGKKPALVFSGGQGGTMDLLTKSGVVDTSLFPDGYFRSDAASGTYNLHAQLDTIAAQAKGLTPAVPIGLTFAASDPRVAKGPAVSSLEITMLAGETDFSYTDGHFVRLRHGEPQSDYQGTPETADNVLVQHVVDEPDGFYDSLGSPSYLSKTVGTGKVTLYRDGHAIDGTWKRAAVDQPFVYSDDAGKPLPFKPGHTWIVLAPQTASVDAS